MVGRARSRGATCAGSGDTLGGAPFDDVVQHHRHELHVHCYRLTGSVVDADDLVQETFIAVFRGITRFRGDSKLSTWVDRIAVRVVFHHIRARGTAPIPLDVIGDVEGSGGSMESQAHARDGLRRLYAALSELSPESRTAFALYAIDGRSIAEVAQVTQTSFVAAKCRIWRARRELVKKAKQDPVLAELVKDV